MFNLTRYYSIASLVCIVLAAAVLGLFYRHLSMESLVEMEQQSNADMAHVLGHALWPSFEALLFDEKSPELTADEIALLQEAVSRLMQGTSVVKVKLYKMDGLTVFSTETAQIGEEKSDNAGFRSAAEGRISSEITHRDTFSAFEKELFSRDLIATYIPFPPDQGPPIRSVFEIYSDITPFWTEVKKTQMQVFFLVIGISALLYGVLYVVVWRAENVIHDQEAALKRTLAQIEEDNLMLDQRVSDRTRQLEEANQALQSEILERKRAEEELRLAAHHDQLTGLPNRMLFNCRLNHSIELARRKRTQLAVLFIDLDQFKNVNDTLGHDMGDELLKKIAQTLGNGIRKSDTLARVGGDEFILLLDDIEVPRHAGTIARNILSLLCQTFDVSGNKIFVSGSIGISFYPHDGEDAVTLVKNADAAMYHAKSQGRNTYEFYSSEMGELTRERVHIASLLRGSITRGELALCFQPQVELATGRLTGAEALVRWNSPELGLVLPERFIPIAEDIGFISELGEWVLREACRQMKAWDAVGFRLPKIGVNLSAKQLERGDILDIVKRALRETDLSPKRLQLEITESAIVGNDQALAVFKRLNESGIDLAVDDFGTGYSSLGHLHRLPFQILKIDRSFITHVTGDSSRKAIVLAIIALAEALGLCTVAEGVETETEAQFLRQKGCRQAQGYLFGRPVGADELPSRWIDSSSQRAGSE